MNLKLTRPMMHGPAVRRLQEWLDIMPDGIFGRDTYLAVIEFQKDHNLDADGIVGPATLAAIHTSLKSDDDVYGSLLYDLRGTHPPPHWYARKRSWEEINGVTLHQTGCPMPQQPERWRKLNAHFGVTQEGLLIWVNDPTDMIWHAQGLSRGTIGIEIEGNFPGLIDNPRTLWKGGGPACTLNPKMMVTLDRLYDMIDNLFRARRNKWERIYGHRQSKDTRVADPGEEIWKAVAIPWMNRSGTTDGGSEFKRGTGRPIPKEWCPQYHRRYWYGHW